MAQKDALVDKSAFFMYSFPVEWLSLFVTPSIQAISRCFTDSGETSPTFGNRPYEESISKETNNDNYLNLHIVGLANCLRFSIRKYRMNYKLKFRERV